MDRRFALTLSPRRHSSEIMTCKNLQFSSEDCHSIVFNGIELAKTPNQQTLANLAESWHTSPDVRAADSLEEIYTLPTMLYTLTSPIKWPRNTASRFNAKGKFFKKLPRSITSVYGTLSLDNKLLGSTSYTLLSPNPRRY